jgi:hypothetical protein
MARIREIGIRVRSKPDWWDWRVCESLRRICQYREPLSTEPQRFRKCTKYKVGCLVLKEKIPRFPKIG